MLVSSISVPCKFQIFSQRIQNIWKSRVHQLPTAPWLSTRNFMRQFSVPGFFNQFMTRQKLRIIISPLTCHKRGLLSMAARKSRQLVAFKLSTSRVWLRIHMKHSSRVEFWVWCASSDIMYAVDVPHLEEVEKINSGFSSLDPYSELITLTVRNRPDITWRFPCPQWVPI